MTVRQWLSRAPLRLAPAVVGAVVTCVFDYLFGLWAVGMWLAFIVGLYVGWRLCEPKGG